MKHPAIALIFFAFLTISFAGNTNLMRQMNSPKSFFYRSHLTKCSHMKKDDAMKVLMDYIIKKLIKKALNKNKEGRLEQDYNTWMKLKAIMI